MRYRYINSNLKAAALVLLIGSALAVSGCKDDPTLFGGCSTQNVNDCPTSEGFANPYEGQLELLSWTETLRKASLELTGQLPTEQQIQATEDLGQLGLEASLAELMAYPAFGDRMIELYNDHFLTDKYLGRENAVDLLDEEVWPNLRWFDNMGEGNNDVVLITNDSIAREPLELIAHVIRNELPFTEILTADYTMLNGYSALSLIGLPDIALGVGEDPERFRTIQIPGIPHAGILTSAMFLNRFPTSDTNRNRHRSRMAYSFFLDIDVNRFGSRPVDASDDFGENPTLNNPDCTVCHTTVDPVAGVFMNWNESGEYDGRGEWYDEEMLAPGFNGEEVPQEARSRALQWFARRLAENPRFAQATVKTVFEGLTGQKVLDLSVSYVMPDMGGTGGTGGDMGMGGAGGDMGMGGTGGMGTGGTGGTGGMGTGGAGGDLGTGGTTPPPPLPEIEPEIAPNVDPALERAYDVQQDILRTIQQRFIDGNYNFKVLVREIVLTPYFRAANATPLTPEMEVELSTFGTARLLTPEHLNRKIEATTGIRWRQQPGRTDYLRDQYRIFYGGIDSDLVTQRVTEPNGVMASLAQRMAYEVACSAVPYDFSKASNQRLLFPDIDRNVAIDDGSDQVREAVRHLHAQLLGDNLAANDPEIDATMVVLTEAYSLGRDGLSTGTVSEDLADPCRLNNDRMTGGSLPNDRRINQDPDYTVRAWMAAVSYLLSDYRYLYE
ncbi:MAG: hypothetical protein O7F08_01525 [Deltaproteobacteria bacterium]|nr:hypothetical protein [Deltaproteobacteria bacterium]